MIRQNFQNFLRDKQFWSILLVVPLLIILITSMSPNIAHALTATPTRTLTPTNTNTPMIAGDLGYGSVHGTVTSASTGAPISGAVVTCSHFSFTSPAKCSGTRTTGADGTYVFSNVFFHDTDQITVVAQASGYTQQTIQQNFFTTPNMTANFSLVASPPTCGTTVVVTSTPTKTPSPTPSATPSATPTKTPTPTNTACGPIYITATPTPTLPPGLPDLIVQFMAIGGNQNCFGSGFQLGLWVTVRNTGTGNAGSFVVSANGATQTVSGGLAAGQSTSLWFAGYNTGTNTATVDSTNLVTESNENNNTLAQQLPVPTPPPNCTPTPTPTNTQPGLPDLVVNSMQSGWTWTNNCSGGTFRPYTNVGIQNNGTANAGTFEVALANSTSNLSQIVSGLAAGQPLTVGFILNGYPLTATVDSTNTVIESNENNNSRSNVPGPGTPTPTNTATGTQPPPFPTCTPTPTPGTPTNTPTRTLTPTLTNTAGTPTPTSTRTPTPTWTNTPNGSDLCSTPTVITGGGSYSVPASGVCFKYVNATFTRGAMWSVMNGSSSTVSNVVKWYGGRNESVTNCINDTQTLNGNGAQINNFTVAKDSANAMYVTITTNQANTVSMSIQNWQNGTGCSVQPTPRP